MVNGKKIYSGLFWKLLERFGVQGSQFVLQIILARLLAPEHYGVLSMMVIFTTLANVFIQRGFNTALIQNKDVTEEDYSSVFWVTMLVAALLYALLFVTAPFIGDFYNMPELVAPFRVLCLVLFPGALNSIQLAKISRILDFKKVFFSNLSAILISGITGMVFALMGAGLWSLVVQFLLNVVVACIVMWFTVKWRPKFVCNILRIKVLFSYGWKLLVSSLIDTLYQDLRSLVIGKKYSSAVMGFYNRGKQFPQFIINAANSTVQSVMLPAMSSNQEDSKNVKALMRQSISMSSYIMFPIMGGLAGVAAPLISILLTDKWLPCVPYMQIYCFTLAFYPIHSCNLQAINAVGRSDIYLKLEVIKKLYGVLALVIAVLFFDSPIVIAFTGVITSLISCAVNAFPCKKLFGYSYFEQIKDMAPSFISALIMAISIYFIQKLNMNNYITIIIQFFAGVAIYLFLSIILKNPSFESLIKVVKNIIFKRKKFAEK